MSLFEEHTLFWNHKRFQKTFYTADSGLPERLFNTGFSWLEAYHSKVSRAYDDSISWAFANKVENVEKGESIEVEISAEDVISFLKGMQLLYNDGSGTKEIVQFAGVDYANDLQTLCEIQHQDGSYSTVYPEMLNFIENPDIASIPQTSQQYCRACNNVEP